MRQVLFDEDVPRQLRREFPEFAIRTVQEEHWAAFKNGELLRRSSQTFDILVSADKRLRFQQNISPITLVSLSSERAIHVCRASYKLRF